VGPGDPPARPSVFAGYGYERNPDLPITFPAFRHTDAEHNRRGAFCGRGVINGFENTWEPLMILDQDQESVAYLQIDGVIVVLPNFGDELGKLSVGERRDAFGGKLSVCNNLYQYGIPFINTTYHTYLIDGAEFHRDLDFFMRVCRVVKGHLDRRSLRRDQGLPGSERDD
jgi:hypothetical protein